MSVGTAYLLSSLAAGGHLTHGAPPNVSGKWFRAATYGVRAEDGRIDWRQSAQSIHNPVRAVAPPYPGAFSSLSGMTLRVLKSLLPPRRRPRPHRSFAVAHR